MSTFQWRGKPWPGWPMLNSSTWAYCCQRNHKTEQTKAANKQLLQKPSCDNLKVANPWVATTCTDQYWWRSNCQIIVKYLSHYCQIIVNLCILTCPPSSPPAWWCLYASQIWAMNDTQMWALSSVHNKYNTCKHHIRGLHTSLKMHDLIT